MLLESLAAVAAHSLRAAAALSGAAVAYGRAAAACVDTDQYTYLVLIY